MAVLIMGTIGAAVAVLVAVEALIKLVPLLIVALAVWAVLRVVSGRHHSRGPARPVPARAPAHLRAVRPVAGARPGTANPGGWVMVPVWLGPCVAPARHPVIDGEVLGEDGVRRV